ncbi:GntR family transcriptional regulator [Mesorhizobium sp. M0563]|uniref:GntR family transcriptional regulator n=1 Tax=unclassified Mesorhizobium TaxID=325217 RepID=UPI0003CE73A1|nr:GntR family transcriptional regulator [Mesorhizobium sp. LSHC420B00]ESX82936.1 GntR family transcriptional regulator [Mesorhizobium sp. LSHC420B00]
MTETIELKRVGDGNLRAQVYQQVRLTIQHGELAPGQKLVDVDIAARLGISRMPVRDALMQLVHEGYLVGTTRGFTLPTLTATDVADIFEVRRLLEPRAAAHAARTLDAAGLKTLAAALREAEAAAADGDADRFFQANSAFRNCWLGAVANERLSQTIARFVDHVLVVRLRTLSHQPTQAVIVAGMRAIYEAFVKRDAVAAYDRMTHFIQNAEERFMKLSPPFQNSDGEGKSMSRRGKS